MLKRKQTFFHLLTFYCWNKNNCKYCEKLRNNNKKYFKVECKCLTWIKKYIKKKIEWDASHKGLFFYDFVFCVFKIRKTGMHRKVHILFHKYSLKTLEKCSFTWLGGWKVIFQCDSHL